MRIDLKSVKGLKFVCKECRCETYTPFENQQNLITHCPNCGAVLFKFSELEKANSFLRNVFNFFNENEKTEIYLIIKE